MLQYSMKAVTNNSQEVYPRFYPSGCCQRLERLSHKSKIWGWCSRVKHFV